MTEEGKNEYLKSLEERVAKGMRERHELESKICDKIAKQGGKKPVLLVGEDKELIQKTTREICSTHLEVYCSEMFNPFENSSDPTTTIGSFGESGIRLREYSCIGKTEAEIDNDLFSLKDSIRYYKNGDMFLVRGLVIPRILKRLADLDKGFNYGVLIINVPSMGIVPQELLDQFEIIELEPKKKGIPDTPEPKGKMGFQKP